MFQVWYLSLSQASPAFHPAHRRTPNPDEARGTLGGVRKGHLLEAAKRIRVDCTVGLGTLGKRLALLGRGTGAHELLEQQGNLAVEHALGAKEAGADGILLMPPQHWLRFGA